MKLSYKSLSFKAATGSADLQAGEFDGYASTFGGVDTYGHVIAPGAFKSSISFFLENGLILREHDTYSAIGKPLDCKEDETGLYIKGAISDTTEGRDALTLLRDGVIRKMSIGYTIDGYEVLSDERGIELLGKDAYDAALKALPYWRDQLTLLTQITLYEVSLVAFPANPDAGILGVKNLAARIDTERDYERFLRDAGFTHKEAKTLVSNGFKALPSGRNTTTSDSTRDAAERNDGDIDDFAAGMKALAAAFSHS